MKSKYEVLVIGGGALLAPLLPKPQQKKGFLYASLKSVRQLVLRFVVQRV